MITTVAEQLVGHLFVVTGSLSGLLFLLIVIRINMVIFTRRLHYIANYSKLLTSAFRQ